MSNYEQICHKLTPCPVLVMCFVIAFASTIMSYNDAKIARKIRKGSRKIVIASASFDHLGRLLVKADGSLPLVTLEEKTLKHEELLQVLDIRSDTFQWLYAVSWAWHMVTPYLGAIATTLGEESFRSTSADKSIFYIILHHLKSLFRLEKALPSQLYNAHDSTKKSSPLASIAISHSMVTMGSRAAIDEFRDKVVDGARRLADQLELPIDEVGILYDKILSTNTQNNQGKHKTHNSRSQVSQRKGIFKRERKVMDSVSDEESVIESRAASVFGDSTQTEEGISIFLVRQVSQVQQNSFAKRGYRFTEPRFLATVLADRHVVDKSLMDETLDSLQQYSTYGIKPLVQPGGVYAGLFGVRPSTTTRQGGLDVLVYHFARHQIPAFRLPDVKSLTNEMLSFLRLLDQLPVEQAMRFCQQEAIRTAERNRAIISMLMEQKNDRIQREFEISSRNNGSISATSSKGIESDDWNESVRHVLGMRNEAVSLQTFQSSLHSALTALLRCARVYQDLATTARISANVLEVPSTLDDSSPPASIILVQAALSGDKKQGRRGSSSTLSGFLGPSRRESRQGTGVLPSAEDSNASVIPTEMPQAGTPFVFYPYTMFAKAQMMIFQGHTAEIFNGQVNTELTRKYSTQHDIAAVKNFYDSKRRSADSQHFNNSIIHEDASSPYRRENSAEKGEEGVEEHSLAKLHRRSPSLGRLLYFRRDSESSLRSQEIERRKSDPCTVPTESKQSQNGIKSDIVSPNQEKERSPTSLGIRRFIENPETAGLPDQRHFARALDEETMQVPVHPLPDRAGSLELNINLKSATEQKERYQEHLSSTSLATHPLNNEARIPTPTSKSDCDVPIANIHLRPRSRTVNDCRLPAATSMLQAIGSSRMSLSHVRRNKSFGHGAQLLKQDETTTDFSSQGENTTLQRHHRLDNWQQHQLNDLERYQPNLLLGVLPSEY